MIRHSSTLVSFFGAASSQNSAVFEGRKWRILARTLQTRVAATCVVALCFFASRSDATICDALEQNIYLWNTTYSNFLNQNCINRGWPKGGYSYTYTRRTSVLQMVCSGNSGYRPQVDSHIVMVCPPSSKAKTPEANLGSSNCPGHDVGNPIDSATGNKYQQELDVTVDGSHLEFRRYYNSKAVGNSKSSVGEGWTHNYAAYLREYGDSSNGGVVLLFRPEGDGHQFALSLDGDYRSVSAPTLILERLETGWHLTDANGTQEMFDALGRLTAIEPGDGDVLYLEYDELGRLDTVRDRHNRMLQFTWDSAFRVDSVTDAGGAVWLYEYGGNNNLSVVVPPDTSPSDPTDNPHRTYLYEDNRFPSHLTGILDERGNRVATWAYDDQGRAIASEHAGGVDNHSLVYNADGTTTVTDPQGRERTYSFTNQHGLIRVASITGGDCSQCGSDSQSYTYDANGYVASKTDFNGHVTTYVRDDLGRERSRTEGVGTSEARTVTTTWHADFNKPLTVTEPGRVVSYRYDPNGRLLAKTEQPQP